MREFLASESLLGFECRLPRQYPPRAKAITVIAAPIPIPALAPVLSPLLVGDEVLVDEIGEDVESAAVVFVWACKAPPAPVVIIELVDDAEEEDVVDPVLVVPSTAVLCAALDPVSLSLNSSTLHSLR
jgi:hypothetical protein